MAPRKVCDGRGRGDRWELQRRRGAGELLRASRRAGARAPPLEPRRCQTAKSAYWMGSSGGARRPRRRRRRGRDLADSTPMDQPSETMWCMHSEADVLARAEAKQGGAKQRAAGEVEGALCRASVARRRASRSRSGRGRRRGRGRGGSSSAGATTCTGRPSTAGKTVRRASWRRTISFRARSSTPTSSGACRRTAAGML